MSESNGTQKPYAVGIRLPHDIGAELRVIARAEGTSVQDQVHEAVIARVAAKRKDSAFQEKLRTLMEEERGVLDRLAQ